ncbi:MAG: ATP-binding protein [Desulfonatronovibrio sp.]
MKLIKHRYLFNHVREDLNNRMVFIGGPRQVGKTTFALQFLPEPSVTHPGYLNWDNPMVRKNLFRGELPSVPGCIVFDEIHKFARWRNLIKGFFDTKKEGASFLVTGSARLDYYSKGGDSLQGRYHYYRLHPFSLLELTSDPDKNDLEHLLRYGGFPEPCLRSTELFWRRWQRERLHKVIYEDIRDLEHVREISLVELLTEDLPGRVGSPLSIKSLKENLQVAHETVSRWLEILERMYFCFRIPPYGAPKIRAVKKEQKLYLWDWSLVEKKGPRLENFLASQLLKYCHFIEDTQGHRMELRFLRDTDLREVDFVVLKDKKPIFAVECKSGQDNLSPALGYFQERTPVTEMYQVHLGTRDFVKKGIRVMPLIRFLKELQLP